MKLLIIAIGIIFMSCNGQNKTNEANEVAKEPIEKGISELQKEVNEHPTKQNRNALATAFLSEIQKDKGSPHNATLFHNAINLFVQNENYTRAVSLLKQTIHGDFGGKFTKADILQLASINEKMGKPEYANAIYASYLKAFPDVKNRADVKAKMKGEYFEIESALKGLVKKMTDSKTNKVNPEVAKDYIEICTLTALANPKEQKNAKYLQKAAEVTRSLRMFPKAIQFYEWIRQSYADTPEAPKALFMEAFTFDEKLNDKEKARKLYELFLVQFPKDDFADDTQFLLDNLDKSNEDIIRKFGK